MLAAECLCTGQAGECLRHSLLVTESLRGVEGLQVPCARGRRVAALLGDEAEFGP
jgi:hypothetical protein